MTELSENTVVRLGAVVVSIGIISGGLWWLSSVFWEIKANSKDIHVMKEDKKEEMKILQDIRERVIRIEERQK